MFGVERVVPTTMSPEPVVVTSAKGLSPLAFPHPRPIDREPPFGKSLDLEFVRVTVVLEFPNDNASTITDVPAEPAIEDVSNAFSTYGKFSISIVQPTGVFWF